MRTSCGGMKGETREEDKMGHYYYGVVPKYKLLVRMGSSHFDGEFFNPSAPEDEAEEGFWLLEGIMTKKVKDLGVLTLSSGRKIAKMVECLKEFVANPYEYCVWYLFTRTKLITEIIPEERREEFKGFKTMDFYMEE
jgi:hypothetical protein